MVKTKTERQAGKAERKRKREQARLQRHINVLINRGVPFRVATPDGPVNPNPPSAVLGIPPDPATPKRASKPKPAICCKEVIVCSHTQTSATATPSPKPTQPDLKHPEKEKNRFGFHTRKSMLAYKVRTGTHIKKGAPMAKNRPRKGSPQDIGQKPERRPIEPWELRGTQVVPIVPINDDNVPSAIVGPPIQPEASSSEPSSPKG